MLFQPPDAPFRGPHAPFLATHAPFQESNLPFAAQYSPFRACVAAFRLCVVLFRGHSRCFGRLVAAAGHKECELCSKPTEPKKPHKLLIALRLLSKRPLDYGAAFSLRSIPNKTWYRHQNFWGYL
jgi:hypothetical protein